MVFSAVLMKLIHLVLLYCSITIMSKLCVLTSLKDHSYLSSLEMCHLVEKNLLYKDTTEGQLYNSSQLLHLCTTFDCKFKYHVKAFYYQFEGLCESLSNKWKMIFTTSQAANLDLNMLVYLSSLTSTSCRNWLECSYLLTITLPITCVWKLTVLVFKLTSSSNRSFFLYKLYFQKESIPHLINHNDTNYCMSSTVGCVETSSKLYIEDVASLDNSSVSLTIECVEAQTKSVLYVEDIDTFRSLDNEKAEKELNKNLPKSNETETSSLLHFASNQNFSSVAKNLSSSEPAPKGLPGENKNSKQAVFGIKPTSFATNILPSATASHDLHYETNFDESMTPLSMEEARKNVRPVPKEKDVDSILQSYQKTEVTPYAIGKIPQPYVQDRTLKSPAKIVPSIANVNKSYRLLPCRACLVYLKDQYHLDTNLLSQPKATKYLIKVRTEITPGRYMARLELQCSSKDDRLPNMDAKKQAADFENDEEVALPTRERKHFPSNNGKIGYIIFTSNLDCFSGSIQYPLPTKKAVASRIGYGGNAIVFVVFHAGKEFAVKKTVFRSKEVDVHSQLYHPNIVNLEAVLIGEKHERHRDKNYIYCFMPKMDINFRNVLSTKEHGCLKHIKMQLLEKRELWEVVLVNVKHVLKSVLKALDYMHSQGLVHRDIKASNILIKMTCQCSEVLYCSCPRRRKFLVQIGDFDSSATVPGYQLQLQEDQMIRYASVLPLGTMGYRAPEVSMHLVLSGPYEILYTTSVDIWSFGCLLLTIFIGKSGPLRQRGEASVLLSAKDLPYSQELYENVIKIKEVQKYYASTSGVCDLVHKCLQVKPHCRPTAKELLQLDFFTS